MAIMGHQIGKAMCDALDLPATTKGFTLRCYSDEVVTITCEYYPNLGASLATELAEFVLVRKAKEAPGEQIEPEVEPGAVFVTTAKRWEDAYYHGERSSLFARLRCAVFGHRWQVGPDDLSADIAAARDCACGAHIDAIVWPKK